MGGGCRGLGCKLKHDPGVVYDNDDGNYRMASSFSSSTSRHGVGDDYYYDGSSYRHGTRSATFPFGGRDDDNGGLI